MNKLVKKQSVLNNQNFYNSNLAVLNQSVQWISRSTPISLLLLESLAPPMEIMLNHQALAFYERALRITADNFFLEWLASISRMQPRLKKRPSWISFCSSQEMHVPRKSLIYAPPPLGPSNFGVSTFFGGCYLSVPGRPHAAADFFRNSPRPS